MIKKIVAITFWLAFFGFFFWLVVPKFMDFTKNGLPKYMGDTWMNKRLVFLLHMSFGTIVYLTGIIQFTPYIRNNYTRFHRALGKVYILSSLICIITLFVIVPGGLCEPCWPSQYIVTSLWLIFVLWAYDSIRQRKIVQHQRMMIRSFICAAYFVTIRIIDNYAMGFFNSFFPNESTALLVSDISVWFAPLLLFEIFWRIRDSRMETTEE